MVYFFNVVVLFGSFIMSILLFLALFESDSVAYTLPKIPRLILKAFLIMLCIGQLHAIEGDTYNEIGLHDLFKDLGQFGLIFFVHLFIYRRHKKRKLDNAKSN